MKNQELIERLSADPAVAEAIEILRGDDHTYVVGGAVRDALLGRSVPDADFVTEDDSFLVAERVAEHVGGSVVRHPRFRTATIQTTHFSFDLATTRTESYPEPGALPTLEQTKVPIEIDVKRRDFTINALALRLCDGELFAVEDALEDLEQRRLRVLHDRSFIDDPTRLLRLARYVGRLGFGIEENTTRLLKEAVLARVVNTVSGPRLGQEFKRLVSEPQPQTLATLETFGLLEELLVSQASVYEKLITRLSEMPTDREDRDCLIVAAVCLDVDPDRLRNRLDVLGFTARERECVYSCVKTSAEFQAELAHPSADFWTTLIHHRPQTLILAAAQADEKTSQKLLQAITRLKDVKLVINGDDLLAAGLRGPQIKQGLEAALVAALRGEANSGEEQLTIALEGARNEAI